MRGEHEIRRLAENQGGYVSRAQCRALGLSSSDLTRLAQSDRWASVTDRVLHLIGAPPVRGGRVHAALLDQGGDAAVSGETAAWWWGLPGFSARAIQLATTSASRHRTSLALVRRIRWLPERWVTELDGLRVVRPELMVLQLCADLPRGRAERGLDNAWRDRLLSGPSIDQLLTEFGRSGRNGITRLRELRDERGNDYVPPASNLEARAIEVLRGIGLDLRCQVDSGNDEMWTGRVDLRDRILPLIIEVQSEKYHTALCDQLADRARRERFEAAGYAFVEITDVELWTAPQAVRSRVETAARRLRAARSA